MANFHWLVLLFLALLMAATAVATQFKVGGSNGYWTVPTDPSAMSYNQWAERNRFQIGDSLLFVYLLDQESVLQVDREAYSNCNTSSYIQRFDDGNTVFTFDRSGPFYFISGVEENCKKNEALVVVVLANRSNLGRGSNPTSSPPSPSPNSSHPPTSERSRQLSVPPPSLISSSPPTYEGSNQTGLPPPSPISLSPPTYEGSNQTGLPPPSPISLSPPTYGGSNQPGLPPPSPEISSSPPPPSGPTEVTPSLAPVGEEFSPPPPNVASAKVMGFMASVGALIGPLLFVS